MINIDIKAELEMSRATKYAAFFRIARQLHSAVVTFVGYDDAPKDDNGADGKPPVDDGRKTFVPLDDANAVSSECRFLNDWHRPVLDLDIPALLIDSSTEGHHHLIIDHPMPWADYQRLLEVMRDVGLLEPGFVGASVERKSTWIRAPWTRKGDDPAPNPAEPPL